MTPSDNNNIVGGFICRNQDKLPMKFLDTLFQMSKREFRFRGTVIVAFFSFVNENETMRNENAP